MEGTWTPTPEPDTFGRRLRDLRRELSRREGRKVTAEMLAERVGVNAKTWATWEGDKHRPPHFHMACVQISDATGANPEWLEHGEAALIGESASPWKHPYDVALPFDLPFAA